MIAPDFKMDCATGGSKATKYWRRGSLTWEQLRDRLENPADHKECGGYVLGKLRNGRRTLETLISRAGVVLDADTAPDDFAEQVEALFQESGWAAALHTTYTSSPKRPRWRVIVPLSRPVTQEEYRAIARWLMRRLGPGHFDQEASEGAVQFMYWPSAADPATYRSAVIHGELLSVDLVLREAALEGDEALEEATLAAYDGPTYEELTPAQREASDAYVQQQTDYWRDQWAVAEEWPDYERDEKGRGWEALAADCAWAFARLGLAPWTSLDEDDAAERYADILPAIVEADEKCQGKWDYTLSRAQARNADPVPASVLNASRPEDVFTPLDDEDDEPPSPVGDAFEKAVEREARRLRVQEAARALLARERLGLDSLPDMVSLAELLDEPDAEVRYRVQDLWPVGGRVLLAAQHKAGKTTLVGNLMRSLVDGEPFLDAYFSGPVGRVVLIDNELSRDLLRSWLRDQGVVNAAAVELLPMRGRMSTFNIVDPVVRAEWAQRIGPADVLVFDCLRPALDANGLSEDKEAGRFLEALDALAAEAGIAELLLVHHMGHSSERSRGDSRLLDWPDAVWNLTKSKGDEGEDTRDHSAPRFFAAYGRDVNVPETQLMYDPDTRHLALGAGTRAQVRLNAIGQAALAFAHSNPGCTKSTLEAGVRGLIGTVANLTMRDAISQLIAQGELFMEKGPRNSNLIYPRHTTSEKEN